MIHTASLVHDDVLDECSIRRGEGGEEGLHGCEGAAWGIPRAGPEGGRCGAAMHGPHVGLSSVPPPRSCHMHGTRVVSVLFEAVLATQTCREAGMAPVSPRAPRS